MSGEWGLVIGLALGLPWVIPAWYAGRTNGINHTAWRVKQSALANGWDAGVAAGLSWNENDGADFAVPNPYGPAQ